MKLLRDTIARGRLFFTVFLCGLVLTVGVSSVTYPVYSDELTVPEKALAFLEDVAMLDMTRYNATLEINDVSYPNELQGLAQRNVVYILFSDEGELEAAFSFKNESFAFCSLMTFGSPLYSEPQSKDIVDSAKDFLQRYQTYVGDPDFDGTRDYAEARSILDTVDVTENVTETSNHVKLEVISSIDYTAFVWEYVLDGVAFPWMSLEFNDGLVWGFDDNWRLYSVGSTDLAFSEEEAITLALDYLDEFSWNATTEEGKSVEVTEFGILEEPRDVTLVTTRNKEPLTLYPSWQVTVYLDDVYPGNVNRITLVIWADTGEVISCTPLGGGGIIPEFTSWTIMFTASALFALVLIFYRHRLSKRQQV
ncbi:MAG: hypothetical protein PVH73_03070 [Candidatus Bathyarchaeota archaeon]|jgi:hypothetical protein